ncbi:MAG: glycosyl hydrolase family 28 protein [Planctomycetota bacterium]|nr:glycosyl hydrolase family 28 protein [Planctomycetota bacterium]
MPNVITWPGPAGEPESTDFAVEAGGQKLFVYKARVRAEILQKDGLWSHKPDPAGQRAAFCIFDATGPAEVVVRPAKPFKSAQVLPSRERITPTIADGKITFTLPRPRHVTLLFDGDDTLALHLFVSEPETDVPKQGDPNVIHFGPGLHEISTLEAKSGQTIYLAGGAVVRAGLKPGEVGTWNEQWKVNFIHGAVVSIKDASNVRICGRGVLDAERVPHPGRSMLSLHGSSDIRLEGVTLRDASNWNVVIGKSKRVRVDNLRIVSGRLNSDGINSVNSSDVEVTRCFVRNHDDSIVCKTTEPGDACEKIRVADCEIWNDWGFGLGVTYETRAPIHDVRFHRCDILSCRHWCLGVHLSDGSTVSDIHFADIEVEDLTAAGKLGGSHAALAPEPNLLKMTIQQDVWGKDKSFGKVHDVTIEDVTIHGPRMLPTHINGADAEHTIDNVTLRHIRLEGQAPATDAAALRLEQNAFVKGLKIEAGA